MHKFSTSNVSNKSLGEKCLTTTIEEPSLPCYLTQSWENRYIHIFPKTICAKVDVTNSIWIRNRLTDFSAHISTTTCSTNIPYAHMQYIFVSGERHIHSVRNKFFSTVAILQNIILEEEKRFSLNAKHWRAKTFGETINSEHDKKIRLFFMKGAHGSLSHMLTQIIATHVHRREILVN